MLEITGILVTSGDLFFQIIEGPPSQVDALYGAICRDGRHTDILLLSVEEDAKSRIFPDWTMKKFSLANKDDVRLEPLRAILEAVVESRRRIDSLTGVLERGVWRLATDA